ncbi:MAG: hypothetical protein V4489_05090 [Chlamydiota bacterium]
MIAESTYSRKFALLECFSEEIFNGIKKEIKREIATKGSSLQKKLGIQSVKETKEVAELFLKNIIAGGDGELGEWVASAWINRHGEIFQCFHEHLTKVSAKYDELTEIPSAAEAVLIQESISNFGALNVYIFCILNSVVISAKRAEELKNLAQKEVESKKEEKETVPVVSVEELRKKFDEQMQKVLEKQEKRILGITERHGMEIAGYRKQISRLQQKLESHSCGV